MEWISVNKTPPEENVVYAVCTYNFRMEIAIPEDCFAIFHFGEWYWWVDCLGDKVEGIVTHYMQLEFPEED